MSKATEHTRNIPLAFSGFLLPVMPIFMRWFAMVSTGWWGVTFVSWSPITQSSQFKSNGGDVEPRGLPNLIKQSAHESSHDSSRTNPDDRIDRTDGYPNNCLISLISSMNCIERLGSNRRRVSRN